MRMGNVSLQDVHLSWPKLVSLMSMGATGKPKVGPTWTLLCCFHGAFATITEVGSICLDPWLLKWRLCWIACVLDWWVASQPASLTVSACFSGTHVVPHSREQWGLYLHRAGARNLKKGIIFIYHDGERKWRIPTWVGKISLQSTWMCGISDFIKFASAWGVGWVSK